MSSLRLVDDEQSESEPETLSSTRSSTPSFSDHPSDHEDERDENGYGDDLSGKRPNTHTKQQLNDNPPVWASSSNPTAIAPVNHLSVSPTNATAEHTEAPNRRPKRVIKHRVQVDGATMYDSDCANSDCDDPKRPGELIQCAGLGCRTKVCSRFVIFCSVP
jgi:hypothetical protein